MQPKGFCNAVMRPILTTNRTSPGMRACAKAWQRKPNLLQSRSESESGRTCSAVTPEGPPAAPRRALFRFLTSRACPTRTELTATLFTDPRTEESSTEVVSALDCATHATSSRRQVPLALIQELVALQTQLSHVHQRFCLARRAFHGILLNAPTTTLSVDRPIATISTDGQYLGPVATGKIGEPLQQLPHGNHAASGTSVQEDAWQQQEQCPSFCGSCFRSLLCVPPQLQTTPTSSRICVPPRRNVGGVFYALLLNIGTKSISSNAKKASLMAGVTWQKEEDQRKGFNTA